MKALVVYFSAEAGVTAGVAKDFAKETGADVYEIVPEQPYTATDLKWMNPLARCNREKLGKKDVPVQGRIENWEAYDTVYLGFPIWYGSAPNVVNTFAKGYDWTGKEIYVFATSGGSGIGKSGEKLAPYVKGGKIADAKRVSSASELSGWVKASE